MRERSETKPPDMSTWSEESQKAADAMMKAYGPPNGATPNHLIWQDKGPWVEIIIRSEGIDHDFPKSHMDVLEQAIPYEVPADKFDDLAEFDGSIIVERTRGTMSARCDKEEMNFLALNLAHDLIEGTKSVDQARQEYANIVSDFMAGKKHAYTQELQFDTSSIEETGDPDQPIMQ